MDPSLIMFGMNALSGLGAGSAARSATRAQNTIRESEVYAANLMRSARNESAAARAGLARFNQAEGNKRIVEDTASVMEANSINYLRARDGQIEDSLDDQIAFAEQAGAQAAAGAASGLTGGVVDMVAGTTALRRARIEATQDTRMEEFAYDQSVNQKNTLLQGLSAMDNSTILTDIDYGMDLFFSQKPQGNVITDIFGGQTKDNLQGFFKAITPTTSSSKQTFSLADPNYIDALGFD